jgi:hypothetical protein
LLARASVQRRCRSPAGAAHNFRSFATKRAEAAATKDLKIHGAVEQPFL